MEALDGNAMAGVLHDLFARDMTTMGYKCTSCGRTGVVAEMVVYMSGLATVARCRNCDAILLVLTERHGMYCIDMSGNGTDSSSAGLNVAPSRSQGTRQVNGRTPPSPSP